MTGAAAPADPPRLVSVQVLPGPGIVARYGDVVVWFEEGEAGGGTVPADLLDLVRALAGEGDGKGAGARLAEVLRRQPAAVPAMVLVAPTAAGIQAVVHGWGRVVADGVDIDGGWVDRELGWTAALAAGRGGDVLTVPTPGSVLDLRRGSTRGGGAAVLLAGGQPPPAPPAATDAPAAAPARATRRAPAFGIVDLSRPPPRRDPLPVGAVAPRAGTTVKGVVCRSGHFNNPIAVVCGTCGTSLGQVSRILQDGIRPSLGALVLDDGTTFGLDADHLVGSAPDAEAEAGGATRSVALVDPRGQVAPVHAELRLVGWDVVLVARAPTFLLLPGSRQWTPVPTGHPTPLPAGAAVAVGQRTFSVESTRGAAA